MPISVSIAAYAWVRLDVVAIILSSHAQRTIHPFEDKAGPITFLGTPMMLPEVRQREEDQIFLATRPDFT